MNNDVEMVKSRVNIVEIVSEKVRLKKAGANYFGLCPFHSERTPSFSVNENIQLFKCFGCGEHGDAITFLMKTENLEFREALEQLAEKVGYKLNSQANPQNVKLKEEENKLYKINSFVSKWYQKKLFAELNDGQKYAKKRGLTRELIETFGIGYAGASKTELTEYLKSKNVSETELEHLGISVLRDGKYYDKFRNRLIFTIYNEKGKAVGFSGRNLLPEDPNFKPPKYLNSPETAVFKKSQLLFGLYQAKESINKLNFVIVSEGQMDIVSSYKAGVKNVVASLGTSFTESHLKVLSRYTENIYLAFDKDNAGKKAMVRTLEIIFANDLNGKIVHWDPEQAKDIDELIKINPELWIDAVNNATDPIEFIFTEFKHKFGLNDIDKVNSLLRTALSLIAKHKNEVKKEFYLKYLGEKLGIPVTALKEDQGRKYMARTTQQTQVETKKINDGKPIQKITYTIFDRIFALILQNWEEVSQLVLALEKDYLPDECHDLYDFLTLFTDDDINVIRESAEDEVRQKIDDLLLTNIVMDSQISVEEHISKMISQSRNEYKKLLVSEWKKNPEDPVLMAKVNKILHQ